LTVTGVDPAKSSGASLLMGRSNLLMRVLSSLVLVPVAIGTAYAGGLVFTGFWMIVALCVIWEWDTLVCAHDKRPVLTIGSVAIAGAAVLLMLGRTATPVALVVLSTLGVVTLASKPHRGWCTLGVLYAGALLIAPVLLRRDATLGFAAIVFLFAVVWLTDITAYFCGRALGGPKLMPHVSPNKTWSGAIGGVAGALLGGTAVAWYAGIGNLASVAAVAFVLSIASQAGDLFESALKRRFDAKDASGLIPGHGGVMDRVDGFVFAVTVAVLIGLTRGGIDAPAHGLLVW
jgi:phosphatidate cytidylyltransferase